MGKRRLQYLGVVGVVAAMAMLGHAAEPEAFTGKPGSLASGPTDTGTVKPGLSKIDPLDLEKNVQIVLGLDSEKLGYEPRIMAANNLSKVLQADTQTALIRFLYSTPDSAKLSANQLNALKNDIANVLVGQNSVSPDLDNSLIEMFRDAKMDAVWRDYCIQFLGMRYSQVSNAAIKKEIWRVMMEALANKAEAIAATALLALYHNADSDDKLKDEVAQAATSAARNADTPPQVRMTALQIGANLGIEELLPVARELAKDEKAAIVLRISAIAAIGTLGNASDLAMLDVMAKDQGSRLCMAAEAARKKIRKRK